MADDTFKPFEDAKKELFDKIPDGSVIDDDKLGDLKKAYEDAKGDLSKIDISAFIKPVENTPEPKKDPSKINEESAPAPAPENGQWKDETLKDWQSWADKNNKLLSTYEDPENKDNLSFKIYADEASKKSDNFEADFSYAGPRNVTLKGKDGTTPDQKYFDELIAQLKAANGPEIEFGNIKSNEFKAKLLAACLKDPEIKITNAPSEQEIAGWSKELKGIINVKPQKEDESAPSKETAYDKAVKDIAANKKDIDISEMSDMDKAMYMAAAMNTAEVAFAKNKDIKLIGVLKAQEALKLAETLPKEEQARVNPGLIKYKIFETKEKIAEHKKNMTKEQQDSYNLRKGVLNKDAKAIEEMDKRRANTMTDEYKYQQEPVLDDKGNPKVDDKGKPIYKKDKDGRPVFKKDKDGKNIETAAYTKFKKRLEGYSK